MATMSFSVPDNVKRQFNDIFAGENKSAILARLMRQAIDERRRERRRAAVVDAVLAFRAEQSPVTDRSIHDVGAGDRP